MLERLKEEPNAKEPNVTKPHEFITTCTYWYCLDMQPDLFSTLETHDDIQPGSPWARNRAWGIWITKSTKCKSSSVVCKLIYDQLSNTVLREVFIKNATLKWLEWNAFQN